MSLKRILWIVFLAILVSMPFNLAGCGASDTNEASHLGATGRGHTIGPGNIESAEQIEEYIKHMHDLQED